MTITAAGKSRWANIITALTAILATTQGVISQPPYNNFILGGILTFAALLLTSAKQLLSPDVSNKGVWYTVILALGAIVTGALDLFNIIPIDNKIGQTIKLILTVLVAVINILSKQIFPSTDEKNKMYQLSKEK